MQLTINTQQLTIDADYSGAPLVWAIRDGAGMTATKFGCGIGLCGSCTVHIDGVPTRSCQTITRDVVGANITTLEGLSDSAETLHPVQQAFLDEQAPQCGWCMSGQMMTAAALIADNPSPTEADINEGMKGNLCRCGTYARIRCAVAKAAILQQEATA